MPYVKITAIVSSKYSPKSIGYQTEPEITEEVLKEAKKHIDSGSSVRLSLDGATIIVSGTVYPPSKELAANTSKILSEAHDAVEAKKKNEEEAHKALVNQYAEAAGLPVV